MSFRTVQTDRQKERNIDIQRLGQTESETREVSRPIRRCECMGTNADHANCFAGLFCASSSLFISSLSPLFPLLFFPHGICNEQNWETEEQERETKTEEQDKEERGRTCQRKADIKRHLIYTEREDRNLQRPLPRFSALSASCLPRVAFI